MHHFISPCICGVRLDSTKMYNRLTRDFITQGKWYLYLVRFHDFKTHLITRLHRVTYLMFAGEEEYEPVQNSNIVLDVILGKELEFITEEKYYAFGKKREPYVFQKERPERIGGMQSLVIDLALGRKKPTNEKERELLKEIRDIEARGGMLDLPLE